MRYFIVVFFSAFISLQAQKPIYSSGLPFKIQITEELHFIAVHGSFAYYTIQNYVNGEYRFKLIKVGLNGLALEETIDLYKEGLKGKIEFKNSANDKLHLFFKTVEKNGKDRNTLLEVMEFEKDAKLSEYTSFKLADLEGEKYPSYSFKKAENRYEITTNGVDYLYFNTDLKPIENTKPLAKVSGGSGSNMRIKGFEMDDFFSDSKKDDVGSFFYPIFVRNIYVESEYKSNSKIYGAKKRNYTSIELSHYNSNTESKTKFYKLNLRPGSMVLDYEVHLTDDSNLVVMGIYQEMLKGTQAGFGLFTVILNLDLVPNDQVYYQQLFESPLDKVIENTSHRILFSENKVNTFTLLGREGKEHYLFQYICRDIMYQHEFGILEVHKKNGEVRINRLNNTIMGSLSISNFNGFYPCFLPDNSVLIFFNDNKKNSGKPASENAIEMCDFKVKECVFSYVQYMEGKGFSVRTALLPASLDKYFIDLERKDVVALGVNDKNQMEFIVPSYDNLRENIRFYKISIPLD